MDMIEWLLNDEEGATLAEYGLLIMLIAIVCIFAIATLGNGIKVFYEELVNVIVNVPLAT